MAHRAVAIDGSILEGGGQILRNASALSAITGCQLMVKDIRANRDKPGLRPQHCTGLQLIASISDGTVQGCHVGSTSMSLVPGRLAARSITGDTGTAGSCMLLCQSILPCCLYAEPGDDSCSGRGLNVEAIPTTHVALKGGTDASMAPVIGYLQHVLVPTLLRLFSLRVSLTLLKRGFFPRGQGRAELQVAALPVGGTLPAFTLLERGDLTKITVHSFSAGTASAGLENENADTATRALRSLRSELSADFEICKKVTRETRESAVGTGAGVILIAESSLSCIFGATAEARRGLVGEKETLAAVKELAATLGTDACVDEWLQDQLIIFAALADGRSAMRCAEPTLHTLTAIRVCEQMLPGAHFVVRGPCAGAASTGTWIIECQGAGWARRGPPHLDT